MTSKDSDLRVLLRQEQASAKVYRKALRASLGHEQAMRETLTEAQRRLTAYETAHRATMRHLRSRLESLSSRQPRLEPTDVALQRELSTVAELLEASCRWRWETVGDARSPHEAEKDLPLPEAPKPYRKGERYRHPNYGPGTVTSDGSETCVYFHADWADEGTGVVLMESEIKRLTRITEG